MTAPEPNGPTPAQTRAIAERDRVADVRSREALAVVAWMGPAMTLLLIVFAVYDVAVNPADQRTWRLMADIAPVPILAAIVLAQRRGWITSDNAGWYVTLGSITVTVTTLATVLLGAQSAMEVNLFIMVVVNGALALTTVQYVAAQAVAIASAVGALVVVTGLVPPAALGDWLVVVAIAVAASLAIHLARENGFRQMARILELLEQQAVEDPLTGLGTRRALEQMFPVVRSSAEISELVVLVVFVDVDGLKAVNDSAGHAAGDQVLLAVARAMRESARSRDVLARWGGDEFALLGVGDAEAASRMALSLTQRLADLNPLPGLWSGTASVGTATASPTEAMLPELVARADESMYGGGATRRHREAGSRVGSLPAPREDSDVPAVTDG
jgi:diguanylate cyclase (GGDEF)-like protein